MYVFFIIGLLFYGIIIFNLNEFGPIIEKYRKFSTVIVYVFGFFNLNRYSDEEHIKLSVSEQIWQRISIAFFVIFIFYALWGFFGAIFNEIIRKMNLLEEGIQNFKNHPLVEPHLKTNSIFMNIFRNTLLAQRNLYSYFKAFQEKKE